MKQSSFGGGVGRWTVVGLLVAFLLTPGIASAAAVAEPGMGNYVGRDGYGAGSEPQVWSAASIFPAPGAPMVFTSWQILRKALKGERPSTSWLVTSYAFSGLGFATGASVMGIAGTSDLANFGVGIGVFAISAINLAITLYGHSRPKDKYAVKESGVQIVPILGRGADGGMFGGLGVSLASF